VKLKAFDMDQNGRSCWGEVDIPFKEITPLHAETAHNPAAIGASSLNQAAEPVGAGPDEMHLTNQPRIVWAMSGHLENTLQSGEIRRSATGEGVYVRGIALHHSSFDAVANR
jgi:hypothetical protein